MAEFCSCGSIIINDHCTNKNCGIKSKTKSAPLKSVASKASGTSAKKEVKSSTRTRRASKCITYNLNDIKKEENTN